MANPLYDETRNINNPFGNMIGQIKEFSKTIQGDPKEIVQGLLNSGKMSQNELNKYAQMAQNILPFLK